VAGALAPSDPIKALLLGLYANPNNPTWYPRPPALYSRAGLVWRLWNYRHQVSHRGRAAFLLRAGIGGPEPEPPISLLLDPQDDKAGHSSKGVQEELEEVLTWWSAIARPSCPTCPTSGRSRPGARCAQDGRRGEDEVLPRLDVAEASRYHGPNGGRVRNFVRETSIRSSL